MTAAGAVLTVAGILLGARAAGHRLVGGRARRFPPSTGIALETAVGLLAVSYLVLATALAAVATPPVLGMLWALVSLAGIADLLLAGRLREAAQRPAGRGWALLGGLLALWTAWATAAATLPPVAIDELVYQLELPRRTLELGALPAFRDNFYGYFPQAGGMLFTLAVAVGGSGAAKLLHAAAGLLTALTLYGATRRLAPDAPAWLPAVVFLTTPTVLVLGAWAYVDLLFTLFLVLALLATVESLGVEDPHRWGLLAGVLAGGAWAVKYTGLQVSLLLALLLLADRLRQRGGGVPWTALTVPGVAFLVAAPWMLRNWWATGWPLFPFHVPGFDLVDGINWGADRAALYVRWLSQYAGPERSLLEELLSPILVFVTARFDGAFDGMAGPVFLAAPLLWLGRRPGRRLGAIWLFVLAYLGYWTLTTTQVRFLVPVLAPLALLLAAALGEPGRRWARGPVLALALLGLGFGVVEVASWEPLRYWRGGDDATSWVQRRVPVASVYRRAEEQLDPGDTVYLVNMRHFGYLLERPPAYRDRPADAGWRSDYVFQHYRIGEALATGTPEAVDDLLRRQGVTHLLIDERLTLAALDEPQRRLLAAYLRRHGRRQVVDPDHPRQALWHLDAGAR